MRELREVLRSIDIDNNKNVSLAECTSWLLAFVHRSCEQFNMKTRLHGPEREAYRAAPRWATWRSR